MVKVRSELNICITDGVSKTARVLLYQIARAELFNDIHIVKLYLTDSKDKFDTLKGIIKEFQLSGIPLMNDISFLNIKEAFAIADILILLHPHRGRCGPDPHDYLQPYVETFKEHGLALTLFGKPSARVVVAGDLANTHARVVLEFANEFSPENISVVTRLNANYGRAVLAEKLEVPVTKVGGVLVTGNSTGVQDIDAMPAFLIKSAQQRVRMQDVLKDDHFWLRKHFVHLTKDVGHATVNVRLPENAHSLAQATFEHLRELWLGTRRGCISSAGVYLDQQTIGMKPGVFVSLPVTAADQRWHVDMEMIWELGCMRVKLHAAAEQLHTESKVALQILAERKFANIPIDSPSQMSSQGCLSEIGRLLDELLDRVTMSREELSSPSSFELQYLEKETSLEKPSGGSATWGSKESSKRSSKTSLRKDLSVEIPGSPSGSKGSKQSMKKGSKESGTKRSGESVKKESREVVKKASTDVVAKESEDIIKRDSNGSLKYNSRTSLKDELVKEKDPPQASAEKIPRGSKESLKFNSPKASAEKIPQGSKELVKPNSSKASAEKIPQGSKESVKPNSSKASVGKIPGSKELVKPNSSKASVGKIPGIKESVKPNSSKASGGKIPGSKESMKPNSSKASVGKIPGSKESVKPNSSKASVGKIPGSKESVQRKTSK